jgi:hypothetical protein
MSSGGQSPPTLDATDRRVNVDGAAVDDIDEIRARVLPHYPGWDGATITRINSGLINRSFLLTRAGAGPAVRAVLQGVSKIFSPAIHDNIAAVTGRLAGGRLAAHTAL